MIMAVRLRVGPPNFLNKVKGIVHHSTTIARFLPDMQVHFLSFLFLSEFEAEVHMSSRNKQLLELLIIMPVYNPSAFDMSSFLNALVFHCCHCFYGLFLAAQTLNFKCISHHWSIRVGLQWILTSCVHIVPWCILPWAWSKPVSVDMDYIQGPNTGEVFMNK